MPLMYASLIYAPLIYILSDSILNPKSGLGQDLQYIVWIDPDIVITDFTFQFENLLQSIPNADIITSMDASKMYMANGMHIAGNMTYNVSV